MLDQFNRKIDYLRISVTDRCNLRCVYCMPETGIPLIRHEDVLSFEEIAEVATAAAEMGVTKIRITGGEPLVRRGVLALVAMLAGISGLHDFAMTTNGILLEEHAASLAKAGLQRVNVSLDALDPDRYAAITRAVHPVHSVHHVIAGIQAAQDAGLDPVKINCVVRESPDEPDARDVAAFARDRGIEVRFIRRMTLASGDFSVVIGGTGGDCARCNRLRLSSNGMVRPCLFNNLAFSVRALGAREALRRAVENKPESGQTSQGRFHEIGG